jgi:hypothetical protein
MNAKSQPLTPAENSIMKATARAAMLRAAEIIDKITEDDVLEQQARGLREGMNLEQVAKIDRAMVASAYLRVCAERKAKE